MKKSTTIYLVRHAEYANPRNILPGRLPVELSARGVEQAKKLSKFFANKEIKKIYSSAVLRCKQTSEIISNQKIPVEFDQRLLETFSAYQGFWIEDWSYFFNHVKELGGETNQDIQDRMVNFYNSLDFQAGRKYIICSHGDPLYFLYQYLDGQKLLVQTETVNFEGYQPKGSVRKVSVSGNGEIEVGEIIKNEELK